MSEEQWTYEGLVAECKRLRGEAERGEVRFFVFLMVVERENGPVWRAAGCATFEQFLNSNTLCDSGRYRFFAMGVDRVGFDVALANGAHWTIQAGRMPQPTAEQLEQFAARAKAFVGVHGVAPSEEAVRVWAAEVRGGAADPGLAKRASELQRLRAENTELRAKLRAAEKLVLQLRSELDAAKLRKPTSRQAGA